MKPARALLQDGTLDPDFWLGDIDARRVGIFRAGLGAILLCDLLFQLPYVHALYATDGLWPTRLGSGALSYVPDAALYVVWAIGGAALLSFSLGIFSRASAALAWLFLTAVHQRNGGVTTGGDFLAQILLFFCIWLDTGAAFSLDARWFKGGREFVAAAPFRAMQVHVAILYFVTARLKIRGGWLHGDGIYLGLQHLGFLRPPGELLLEYPALCRIASYVVLAAEGSLGLLALSPVKGRQARLAAALCGLCVQLGILGTMRVGMFTALMLWTCVLYLPVASRPAPLPPNARRARWLATAGCGLVVVLLCWGVFVGKRFPLPRALQRSLQTLGLVQPYDLFGATYEVARWHAVGSTTHGTQLDLLAAVAPGLRSSVGWAFSPLYKLTFARDVDQRAVASWLCRETTRVTGESLSQVTLGKHAHEPNRPGTEPVVQEVTLYSGPCP